MKTHALIALWLGVPLVACDPYDPPPEATILQPAVGFWTSTTPIEIVFTEPIEPASLVINVWPSEVDLEGNFRPDVMPLIDRCSLATSPCGAFVLALDDKAIKATLTQNDAFKDREGKPLVIELLPGLADRAGRQRKVPTRFDFQANPRCGNEAIDIDLETGVLSLTANLQVLPIWLHMYLDFAIDRATGKVLVVGTVARLQQRQPQLGPNYNHPDGFQPEAAESAWAVSFTGCLVKQGEGKFFLQSDPFDVSILVLNTIPVTLTAFQVQGTISPGGATEGRDFVTGLLSTSGGSFGDPPNAVDPITTSWDGYGFRQDELPAGLPRVCAEAPCTDMDATGGDCQLPAPWEPGPVCP